MIEKDVQKRILKAILDKGGTANTDEIMELSEIKRYSVHGGARHLVSRALIRKHPRRLKPNRRGYDKSVFSLNQNLIEKIKRLISEIGQ